MENKQGLRGPPGTTLTVGRGRRRTRDLESLGGGRQGCGAAPSQARLGPASPASPAPRWLRGGALVARGRRGQRPSG